MDILYTSFGPLLDAFSGEFPTLLALVLLAGMLMLMRRSRRSQQRFRAQTQAAARPTAPRAAREPGIWDHTVQLKAIGKVDFERQPLLNRTEYRVLPILEDCMRRAGRGHRVMAQTVLGEIIKPRTGMTTPREDREAQASINSKRVDMVVIDRGGYAVLAVEVHGSGHHQGTAYLRDAVKREALRRAGIPMLEIDASWSDEDIERRLSSLVGGRRPDARTCRA